VLDSALKKRSYKLDDEGRVVGKSEFQRKTLNIANSYDATAHSTDRSSRTSPERRDSDIPKPIFRRTQLKDASTSRSGSNVTSPLSTNRIEYSSRHTSGVKKKISELHGNYSPREIAFSSSGFEEEATDIVPYSRPVNSRHPAPNRPDTIYLDQDAQQPATGTRATSFQLITNAFDDELMSTVTQPTQSTLSSPRSIMRNYAHSGMPRDTTQDRGQVSACACARRCQLERIVTCQK
jgi:hypothetical protein